MTHNPATILVTGATGQIGTALVHLLAGAGGRPRVRAATRSPGAPAARLLRAFSPATVEPVRVDDGSPESWAAACAGASGLCVIAPVGPAMDEWHDRVAAAAAATGSVRRIVKVSVTGARPPESDPPPGRFPRAHWHGEEALRRTGIPTVAIRPTIFMQHFLTMPGLYTRGDDRFYLPTGGTGVAFLDCRDIAAAAAALILADEELWGRYAGGAFELTGPAAVTAAEIAEALAAVAGRPFAHVDGEEAFVAHCQAVGAADTLKFIYAEAREGWFSALANDDYLRLTGRLPTSFAKFAHDHAAFFQGAAHRES